jgi:hypothetical protein
VRQSDRRKLRPETQQQISLLRPQLLPVRHRNEFRKLRSAEFRDTTLMTIRCDHCRGTLGRNTRRYFQMRFCSPACVGAYQSRLQEQTKVKIGRLGFATAAGSRKAGLLGLDDFVRQSPA